MVSNLLELLQVLTYPASIVSWLLSSCQAKQVGAQQANYQPSFSICRYPVSSSEFKVQCDFEILLWTGTFLFSELQPAADSTEQIQFLEILIVGSWRYRYIIATKKIKKRHSFTAEKGLSICCFSWINTKSSLQFVQVNNYNFRTARTRELLNKLQFYLSRQH